jgi:catechol 2,3-dioxygenase-like lactoylglutathione lyase family enzyme
MSDTPLQVGSVSHVGIVVSDLDAVGEFFEHVLGFRRLYDDSSTGVRLRGVAVDDVLIELIEYPDSHPMWHRSTGVARMHLGFTVGDVALAHRRALELGFEVLAAPKTVGPATYCYLQGPEALVVELVEYDGGSARATQLFDASR